MNDAVGNCDMNTWPRTEDGEFLVGGQRLSQVVTAVGGTPCYLYDRQRLKGRAASLRRALSAQVRLHYALKANPMPAVVCCLANVVDGADVASAGELRVALDSGMTAAETSFAGPGKGEKELEQAHAANVLINVESAREVRLLTRLSDLAGRPARVAVRVNLPYELRGSGMKMAGGSRPFGVDAEMVPMLLKEIVDRNLALEGFHLFAGSQNLNAGAIIDVLGRGYEWVLQCVNRANVPLRSMNLGGGFGIPYTEADAPLDVDAVVDHLNGLGERLRHDRPEAHIVVELGRYLVGEAGLYVCRIVDRKVSRGQVFVVANGGMHHHLAASGNFGQVIRKNFPIAINGKRGKTEVVNVVGPLCTPLDRLADKATMACAAEGDLLVIRQSGAYGRSASPRSFLGHPDVVEALV